MQARFPSAERLIRGEAVVVGWDGEYLARPMRKERLTREDIVRAIRSEGFGVVAKVRGVVFETSGGFSVVTDDSVERADV